MSMSGASYRIDWTSYRKGFTAGYMRGLRDARDMLTQASKATPDNVATSERLDDLLAHVQTDRRAASGRRPYRDTPSRAAD